MCKGVCEDVEWDMHSDTLRNSYPVQSDVVLIICTLLGCTFRCTAEQGPDLHLRSLTLHAHAYVLYR